MTASPDEPPGGQEEFVFDEDFVAGAAFKEPSAMEREADAARDEPITRRRFLRLGGRKAAPGRQRAPGRARRLLADAKVRTILVIAGLVLVAVVLNFLDPLGLHG